MRRPSTTWPVTVRVGVLVLAAAAVVVASVATGVLGTGDESPARAALADPAQFAERIDDPAAYLINVHTPYEGEIEGTDEFIPFDRITGDPRLPADKDTEVLLYCRSGRMSAIAADVLTAAGYTNVVDLRGGMIAWEATRMTVVDRSR